MKGYWGLAGIAALLLVHAFLTPPLEAPDRLLRVADGALLTFDEFVPELFEARAIFVGELHDQRSHHQAQLRVIRSLHEADRPTAVALEMFRADAQESLDLWVGGILPQSEFLRVYYDNWSAPWVSYAPILLYAREHKIPLLGLNVTADTVRDVARGGFASLSAAQRERLPPVTCEVDDAYEDFIRRAMGMHGQRGRSFVNFCEAQLLWDTVMAVNLARFLEAEPQVAVVVLAGSGHAWKRGIPARLAERSDASWVSIVPEIPERVESGTVTREDADYLWMGLPLW